MKNLLRRLVLLVTLAWLPMISWAGVFVSVGFAPPPLPVYEQPLCPGPGYLWTPGYWGYDEDDGYYWVPGTWALAPEPGLLWTPGYWGWSTGFYFWHAGYWGPHVGFYGGVDYGFGYNGIGYQGGYWNHGEFNYNRAVNNVNVTNIHNTYNSTVVNNTNINRTSYNGGQGGTTARPSGYEQRAANDHHFQPTASQGQHQQAARGDPSQRFSANNGRPGVFATSRPGLFHGSGAVTRGSAAGRGPIQAAAQNRAQSWTGQQTPVGRTASQGAAPRYQYQRQEPRTQQSQLAQQPRQQPQVRQSWASQRYGQQAQYRQSWSQPRNVQAQTQPYRSNWAGRSYSGPQSQYRASYAQPRYQAPAWQGRSQFSGQQFQQARAPQFSQSRSQMQPHWGGGGGGGGRRR